MLKKITYKKLIISTLVLCFLMVLYFVPSNSNVYEPKQSITYNNYETIDHEIYLLDSDGYAARTKVVLNDNSDGILEKARELIETLIVGGEGESKLPNGFRSIIPSGTIINNIEIEDGVIEVDFSDDILEINENYENKMLETIIYTLTSIDGVENVILLVNGEKLEYLPSSQYKLPKFLNRTFGINKQVMLSSLDNINAITVFYINRHDEDYYYVPVTKYVNDDRNKIEVIIEELSSGPIYETNLMSFLNSNVELKKYEYTDNIITLEFDRYLYSDLNTDELLEEVIYTICLSIKESFEVEKVIFYVEDEEILETVLKNIE